MVEKKNSLSLLGAVLSGLEGGLRGRKPREDSNLSLHLRARSRNSEAVIFWVEQEHLLEPSPESGDSRHMFPVP